MSVYLVAGAFVVAWKAFRDRGTDASFVPDWMLGVLPNFLPAAFLPMLVFASRRVVRPGEYLQLVLVIAVALCGYEFAQIWMPRRTFDEGDIAASAAGACLGYVCGWLLFFRCLGKQTPPSESR